MCLGVSKLTKIINKNKKIKNMYYNEIEYWNAGCNEIELKNCR